MDHIFIDDIEVYARHGVSAEEQKLGQKFLVSIDMELSVMNAAKNDDLAQSVNYAQASQMAVDFMMEHTFRLIESAADGLAEMLLDYFDILSCVNVTIKKPWAPVGIPLDTVGVSVTKRWKKAVIAFGSNIGDRSAFIEQGLSDLQLYGIKILKRSDNYNTKPVGGVEQDDFLNGVVLVKTLKSPEELLEACHMAENNAGRERKVHWGPRTLDLDIISYEDLCIETKNLVLPHPEAASRRFVLEPLAAICPDWVHPVLKETAKQLLAKLPTENMRRDDYLDDVMTEKNIKIVDDIRKPGIRVVFQGEEGAYTQAAMLKYFGADIDSFHVPEWSGAVDCVVKGEADFAVLPIENSSAGAITQVTDLLINRDVYIVAEEYLPVSHCLLGAPGAKIEDIRTVYSHPQALMQCARYLEDHRQWQQISMKNTAFSAQKVRNDADVTQAAIASEISAKINHLDILERGVNDNKNNVTRFVILANKPLVTSHANRISICVELTHEVGSLYRLLSYISIFGLNMEKIESRPIPNKNFEYRFFIDFEGNIGQPDVVSAMRGIRRGANRIWFLGNY